MTSHGGKILHKQSHAVFIESAETNCRNTMVEGPGCKLKGEKIKGKLIGQNVKQVSGNAVNRVWMTLATI